MGWRRLLLVFVVLVGRDAAAAAVPCPDTIKASNSLCNTCPAGTYWSGQMCNECPAGHYAVGGARGIDECLECPRGFFAERPGTAVCQACESNQITLLTGSTSREDCYCTAAFWNNTFSSACEPCDDPSLMCLPGPDVAFSQLGDVCRSSSISLLPSFCKRVAAVDQLKPLPCALGSAQCVSALERRQRIVGDNMCGSGYSGILCQTCDTGYGKYPSAEVPTASCIPCWVFAIAVAVQILAVIIVAIIATRTTGNIEPGSRKPNFYLITLRSLLAHFKLLAVIKYANIPWRGELKPVLELFTFGAPLAQLLGCIVSESAGRSAALNGTRFLPVLLPIIEGLAVLVPVTNRALDFAAKSRSTPRDGRAPTEMKHSSALRKSVDEFVGASLILIWTFLPDLTLPLLRILSCVQVPLLPVSVLAVDMGVECHGTDWTSLVSSSAAVGSILTFAFPLALSVAMWFSADVLSVYNWSAIFGYFTHGYHARVRVWYIVCILQQVLLTAFIAFAPAATPRTTVFTNKAFGLGALRGATKSEPVKVEFVFACIVVLAVVEFLREAASVEILDKWRWLSRLSFLGVFCAWVAAAAAKADGASSYALYSAVERQLAISVSSSRENLLTRGLTVLATFAMMFNIAYLCMVAALLLSPVVDWTFLERYALKAAGIFRRLHPVLALQGDAAAIENPLSPSKLVKQGRNPKAAVPIPCSWFSVSATGECTFPHSSMITAKRLKTAVPELQQLPRCADFHVLRQIDIESALECIAAYSADVLTCCNALIRLSLHPWIAVATEEEALHLLATEGFRSAALTEAVRSWLELREQLFTTFGSLQQTRLQQLWWRQRTRLPIRYPALEDASLDIVPRYSQEMRRRKFNAPLPQRAPGRTSKDSSGFLFFRLPTLLTRLCSTGFWRFLRGKKFRPPALSTAGAAQLQEFLAVAEGDVVSVGESLLLLQHAVVHRALACLFLDLSGILFGLPRSMEIKRYPVNGVVPGTRNDGKSDEVLRRLEIQARANDEQTLDDQQRDMLYLGKILREAQDSIWVASRGRKLRSASRQGMDLLAFAAATPSESASQRREFEEAVEATRDFMLIFPDATPCTHSYTGELLALPRADKIIRVFENLISVKTPETSVVSQLDNVTDAIAAIFKLFRGEGVNGEETNLVVVPLLFELTTRGSGLHVEPTQVGIFVHEMYCCAGPRDTLTALKPLPVKTAQSRRLDSSGTALSLEDKLHNDKIDAHVHAAVEIKPGSCNTEWGALTLDPVIELTRAHSALLMDGSSDWTLQVDVSVDLTEFTYVQYHCVAAAANGLCLLVIEHQTRRLGIGVASQGQVMIFKPFEGKGTLVEARSFPSRGKNSDWVGVTVTAAPRPVDSTQAKESPVVTTFTLYIDGELAGYMKYVGTADSLAVLGNSRGSGPHPSPAFSDVRVWSRVLSAAELARGTISDALGREATPI